MLTFVWIATFTLTLRHQMDKVLIYVQMLFIFSTRVLIRHLWQLKTVVFVHWCLIHVVLLTTLEASIMIVAKKQYYRNIMMPSLCQLQSKSDATIKSITLGAELMTLMVWNIFNVYSTGHHIRLLCPSGRTLDS